MKTHALLVLGVTLAILAACGPGTTTSTAPSDTTPASRTLSSAQPANSTRVPDPPH